MDFIQPGQICNGVLVGCHNHLFLFGGQQQQFSYLIGDKVPSIKSVNNFYENLYARYEYCCEREIQYLHLVFPSKPVVQKNFLPHAWRDRVRSLYLSSYESTLSGRRLDYIYYPLELLEQLEKKERVFHEFDTHLNGFGGLSVVLFILRELGLEYDRDIYFKESIEPLTGDLARMLGWDEKLPGRRFLPVLPISRLDNRSALPGNTNNIVVIHNPGATTNKRLLIFGDSFISLILHYFRPCFRDILFARSATFQSDMVEFFGPDVVISANAERYLSNVIKDRESYPMLSALHSLKNYCPSESFSKALTAQLAWSHNREVYEEWRQNQLVAEKNFIMDPLGMCRRNDEIEVLDFTAGTFESLGKDPFFVFPQPRLSAGRRYMLRISMSSDVSSVAKIYFKNGDGAHFDELNVVQSKVVPGNNELLFKLDNIQYNFSLRFDPISRPGRFSICKIVIEDM